MRSTLTDDEVDLVMANIHPSARRWCSASCGLRPGEEPGDWACACIGCIHGSLTWDEFAAWEAREARRDATPHIGAFSPPDPRPRSLTERLAEYKASKQKHPS